MQQCRWGVRFLCTNCILRSNKGYRTSGIYPKESLELIQKGQEKIERKFTRMMRQKFGLKIPGVEFSLKPEAIRKMQSKPSEHKLKILSNFYAEQVVQQLESRKLQLGKARITLSKVNLSKHCDTFKVHWLVGDQSNVEQVQNALDTLSADIRSEIREANHLSFVPDIQFLPDLSQLRYRHLQDLFDRADYGPDFKPKHVMSAMETNEPILRKRVAANSDDK